MRLLQVKGNIARITYNPTENHLLPSDFLLVEDTNQKLIAQIVNIATTQDINVNVADLRLILSIDQKDNLSYYNGYIPLKTANVIYIKSDEIVELIKSSGENIYIGNLSNHSDCFVKIPVSSIDDRLYIQSDRYDKVKILVQNLVSELVSKGKKVVILDFDGYYNSVPNTPRIKITESFKLPLNAEAFNNILEYDTTDCPIEDKALIQSIVLELREYIKTVDNNFLPFTLFKTVIDNEYASNKSISGLMLLRNKLWMYAQENIFAESKKDFDIINTILTNQDILIIDASAIEEKWYKFTIETIQNIINKNCYFVMSLNDINADKKTITGLYNKQNIVPVISTSYDSKYRQLLKSLCKNQILFKPSKPVADEDAYNYFLNRINSSEFILYGETALFIPLLIELQSFDSTTKEAVTQNEITKEVDKFFSSSKNIIPSQNNNSEILMQDEKENIDIEPIGINEQTESDLLSDNIIPDNDIEEIDDDFNDDDLDFLDSQNEEQLTIDDIKNSKKREPQRDDSYDIFVPVAQDPDIEIIPDTIEETQNDIEYINHNENINPKINSETNIDENLSEIENIEDNDLFENIPEDESILSDTNESSILDNNEKENDNEIKYTVHHSDTDDNLEDESLIDTSETETVVTTVEATDNSSDNTSIPEEEHIFRPMGVDPAEDIPYIPEEEEKPKEESEEKDEVNIEADVPLIEQEQAAANVDTQTNEIPSEETKENDILSGNIIDDDEEDKKEDESLSSIDDVISNIEDKAAKQEEEKQTENKEEEQEKTPDAPPVNTNIQEKKSPDLPYYETNISDETKEEKIEFNVGDKVFHPKHGKGVVMGFAQYKNTMYCRIEFEGEGYRILDPRISALEKI